MNFREDRSSMELEEISRLREQLQRANQRARLLEIEIQWLRKNNGRGYHRQEGSVGNYQSHLHSFVDDGEQDRGTPPGDPVEELPNLEEEFNWDNVLLDGEEEEKIMQPEKEDTSLLEEDIQKEDIQKEKSQPTDEGCCMFCSRTIISEGDESEHYRHCPEYNRWTGSENNSFYSPQYCPSSYNSNHSPSTRYVPHRNQLLGRRSY